MVGKFVYAESTFTKSAEVRTGGGVVIVEHDAFILPPTGIGLDLGPATWTVTVDGTIDSPGEPGLVFEANASGILGKSTLAVGADATIRTLDKASAAVQSGVALDVTNAGLIQGGAAGIVEMNLGSTSAKGFTITNAATGTISGQTGIQTAASSLTLTVKNLGLIAGTAQDAIDMTGPAIISNGGRIVGDIAAFGTGAVSITNLAGATITGDVSLSTAADIIKNTGAITGNLDLSDGKNSINNAGTIGGHVSLGGGDDMIVTTSTGVINGAVDTGDGKNSVTNGGTLNAALLLGNGDDTVVNSGTISGSVDLDIGHNKLTNSGHLEDSVSSSGGINLIANTGTMTAWSLSPAPAATRSAIPARCSP